MPTGFEIAPRKEPVLMHRMSRRSVALIATAATLGAGSITTAAQASDAISAPSGVAAAPQTRLLGSGSV